jgi:hypothetical protein
LDLFFLPCCCCWRCQLDAVRGGPAPVWCGVCAGPDQGSDHRAGLNFKLPPPFQNVSYIDKRLLTLDSTDTEPMLTQKSSAW